MSAKIDYGASRKYVGDVAAGYDKDRIDEAHWRREQEIVAAYVKTLPEGAKVADIPFGTGRFIPLYLQRGLSVLGADISDDMLAVARNKIGSNPDFTLERAAAEELPFQDGSADFLICHRFIKWLPSPAAVEIVMREFARVVRREMLIQVKLEVRKKRNLLRRLRKLLASKPDKVRTQALSQSEWERIVASIGFSIKSVSHHPEISGGIAYYIVERKLNLAGQES